MRANRLKIAIVSPRWSGTLVRCQAMADGLLARLKEHGTEGRSFFMSGALRLRVRSRLFSPLRAPHVVISCGAIGERRARELRAFSTPLMWIHLDELSDRPDGPDLAFISPVEWKEEFASHPHYIELNTILQGISHAEIAAGRAAARARLKLEDNARAVVLLIGGSNPAFVHDEGARQRMVEIIGHLKAAGARILASTSRRTDPETTEVIRTALAGEGVLYAGEGPNPYRDFLAAADEILVTEDSITMAGEAIATGRPVSLLPLTAIDGERLQKSRRFHARMQAHGMLHPYGDAISQPAPLSILEEQQRAIDLACAEVERRLAGLKLKS